MSFSWNIGEAIGYDQLLAYGKLICGLLFAYASKYAVKHGSFCFIQRILIMFRLSLPEAHIKLSKAM